MFSHKLREIGSAMINILHSFKKWVSEKLSEEPRVKQPEVYGTREPFRFSDFSDFLIFWLFRKSDFQIFWFSEITIPAIPAPYRVANWEICQGSWGESDSHCVLITFINNFYVLYSICLWWKCLYTGAIFRL